MIVVEVSSVSFSEYGPFMSRFVDVFGMQLWRHGRVQGRLLHGGCLQAGYGSSMAFAASAPSRLLYLASLHVHLHHLRLETSELASDIGMVARSGCLASPSIRQLLCPRSLCPASSAATVACYGAYGMASFSSRSATLGHVSSWYGVSLRRARLELGRAWIQYAAQVVVRAVSR